MSLQVHVRDSVEMHGVSLCGSMGVFVYGKGLAREVLRGSVICGDLCLSL